MTNKQISSRPFARSIAPILQRLAVELVETGEAPRIFLSFLRMDRQLEPTVVTASDWIIQMKSDDKGLLGAAMNNDEIMSWAKSSSRPQASEFIHSDPRTIIEIAFPVHLNGGVTGVGMVDIFESDPVDISEEQLIVKASEWQQRFNKLIQSPELRHQDQYKEISHFLGDCIKQTGSLRGFIALRHWSGSPIYIVEGKGHEKFLPLSLDVGMVGEAFHSGEIINEGNVWMRPGYIPSDDRISSELVIPMIIDGKCFGVLNLEATRERHYSEERILIAIAFKNKITEVAWRFIEEDFNETEKMLVQLGGHLQETFTPIRLDTRPTRNDQLITSKFGSLVESVEALDEVERARVEWLDTSEESLGSNVSTQIIEKLKKERNPLVIISNGQREYLYGLKVLEDVVALMRVVFIEPHSPNIIDLVQLFVYTSISEITRRIEDKVSISFENFVGNVGAGIHREDAILQLKDFFLEYFHCEESLILSFEKLQELNIFSVYCASPRVDGPVDFPVILSDDDTHHFIQAVESSDTLISERPRYHGSKRVVSADAILSGPSWSLEELRTRSVLVFAMKLGSEIYVVRLKRSTTVGSAPFNERDKEKANSMKSLLEKVYIDD